MGIIFSQISAVVVMNIRSLPQRIWMSLATILAVAVVVSVLLAFLAMANGFRTTVASSGSEALAVVMREGSQAELNSVLRRDQVNILATSPGIKKDEDGPVVSAELYVIVDGYKRSTGGEVNLPFRGLSERGIAMRGGVNITKGRMFEAGKNEIVVGAGVLREFTGFELNSEIKLGNALWTVVGVFEATGSVFESELWTDVRTLQSQFNREGSYQVARLALETPGDISQIEAFIENDPQLNFDTWTEKDYFREQAKGMSDVIFYLGWPLAIVMALGALSGALNTMYTSVAQRAVEIATLRAIGFSNYSAFIGTLVEALTLAFLGGIIGTIAAYLFFDLIHEVLTTANFPAQEFDLLKAQKLSQLTSDSTNPQMLAFTTLFANLNSYPSGHMFNETTVSQKIAGTEAVTLDKVKAFYRNNLGGDNIQVGIAGDFDSSAVQKQIEKKFSAWTNREPYRRVVNNYQVIEAKQEIIETPDKKNAFFVVARNLDLKHQHEDAPALYIATRILGGGILNSRLATRIRQQDGLSYSVRSVVRLNKVNHNARWITYAISAPQNTEQVHQAFIEEMERAYKDGFTQEELTAAIEGLLDEAKVRRSNNSNLAQTLRSLYTDNFTLAEEKAIQDKIRALTLDDVNRVMRKYLDHKSMSVVKAGDFASVSE